MVTFDTVASECIHSEHLQDFEPTYKTWNLFTTVYACLQKVQPAYKSSNKLLYKDVTAYKTLTNLQ